MIVYDIRYCFARDPNSILCLYKSALTHFATHSEYLFTLDFIIKVPLQIFFFSFSSEETRINGKGEKFKLLVA